MKKKIGIMSMQRVINYGSFLQAFALMKTLEKMGYDVQFVDYNYERTIIPVEKKSIFSKFINKINIYDYLKRKIISVKFTNQYNNEYCKLIGVNQKNYNPKIDALVIGSDEVFNCMQGYPVGYSRELFGKNYENIKVISYAASFGHTTLDQLKDYHIDKEVGSMLKKFKQVSVRDENSYNIVKTLTNKEPSMNLDPVLIFPFDEYITNNVSMKDYIIIYAYTGRLTKEEENYIIRFAKKHKKKIVSLGMYQKIADYNLVVSPFEVLEYIKKADYVITDTFHGTIFSIINKTKFCTIIRTSNKNKLSFLLRKLYLCSQMVNSLEDIEKIFNKKIDFTKTNEIIKEEQKKAYDYLRNGLK